MSTTRVSKTPTAASFSALAGLCAVLAGIALSMGALAPAFPLLTTELGQGWGQGSGEGPGLTTTVTWAFVIGEYGVARCQLIQGDWKPGDPLPPAEEEPASEVEVTAEADDAFDIDDAAADSGTRSDDAPPQSAR